MDTGLVKIRTDAQRKEGVRQVGPTLILGLGGTGKDVLLRMRRLLVEHYGRLDDLPFLRFLHMDTDQSQEAREQYDLKGDDDPLHDLIQFEKNELVDLRIPQGTGSVINNIDAYPHIKGWFQTKGRMHNLGDLGKGAGQVRMASRLAFYLNSNTIKNVLQRVGTSLLQADVAERARQLGFDFELGNRNVYVVGSLAGGTGSGVFIDLGFLLKQVLGEFSRVGFFLLPAAFGGLAGENRMKANGYAALMELNHYSFGHGFTGQWDQGESRFIAPPPFETTYLIDAENAVGTMAQPNELYQMIAESLFHEFSLGGFADKKRSVRINLEQFSQNAYLHPFWKDFEGLAGATEKTIVGDSFTLRFSSFGQATLACPVDKIVNACACRLGREVISLWQQQVSQSSLEELFTRFLSRQEINFAQGDINLSDGGRLDQHQIETELGWYNKDAGISYRQFFWGKIQDLMEELRRLPMKSKADGLARFMEDIEGWFGHENSAREAEWGQVPRDMADAARDYRIRVQQAIERECDRLANVPHYGIAHVLAILREFKAVLRSELGTIFYIPFFEERIEQWGGTAQYHRAQLETVYNDLRTHERQWLHRTDDVNRDLRLLCYEDGDERGILDSYLYARTSRLIARWGKEICLAIDTFLGKDDVNGSGLIARYRKLFQSLDAFKDRLSGLEQYFKRVPHYSHSKNLFDEKDFDAWYNVWVGGDREQPVFSPRLAPFADDLLRNVFKATSVAAALNTIRSASRREIEYALLKRCRALLEAQADSVGRPSALQALFEREGMNESERRALIQGVTDFAKVWVHPPTDLGHLGDAAAPDSEQNTYYVGLDTHDRHSDDFMRELEKVGTAGAHWQKVSLGGNNQGSIVFFHELCGIPAFYPRSVTAEGGMRQWYRKYFVDPQKMDPNNQDVLHTDKNRFLFSDIIPKNKEQAEYYQYAVWAFTIGKICGLLRMTKEDDGIRFQYVDAANAFRPPVLIDLGVDEDDAIDFFYQRDQSDDAVKLYRKINDQVDFMKDSLRKKNLLCVYILLLEFYRNFVYQPETDEDDVPGVTLKRYMPQYAAIAHELARMTKFVHDSGLEMVMKMEQRAIMGRFLEPKRRFILEQRLPEAQQTLLLQQIDNELESLCSGAHVFTEEEYLSILEPYCLKSGRYMHYGADKPIGGKRSLSREALVLDRERVVGPMPATIEDASAAGDYGAVGGSSFASGFDGHAGTTAGSRRMDAAGAPSGGRSRTCTGPAGQQPGQSDMGGGSPGGERRADDAANGNGAGASASQEQAASSDVPPGSDPPHGAGAPHQGAASAADGTDAVICPDCQKRVPRTAHCSNCGRSLGGV